MGVNYAEQYEPDQLEPFWPNEILKMISVVLCTMAVIMFFAVLPVLLEIVGLTGFAEHEQPADPRTTPSHIRPEWYFLSVYQYLKLMPSQMLGVEGAALGVLSQSVGVVLLLTLPFWYRDGRPDLDVAQTRRGVAWFSVACLAFVVSGYLVSRANAMLSDRIGAWLHPVFWWPVLAVGCWGLALVGGRMAGFDAVGRWLMLLTVSLLFVLFQFVMFVIVLGRWLAGLVPAGVALTVGAVIFLAAAVWALKVTAAHLHGRAQQARRAVFIVTVTENVALFLGLMVWAKWPHDPLLDAAGALTEEARHFAYMLVVVIAAVVLFASLVAVERRNITRVLGPRHKEDQP
ncbi:MAG: hypothetical protein C4547_04190 [Phycisphaerales bacterium]|nr:MAG: hypothetical protein C4547_04190 [Phycisphaerales bacterium]